MRLGVAQKFSENCDEELQNQPPPTREEMRACVLPFSSFSYFCTVAEECNLKRDKTLKYRMGDDLEIKIENHNSASSTANSMAIFYENENEATVETIGYSGNLSKMKKETLESAFEIDPGSISYFIVSKWAKTHPDLCENVRLCGEPTPFWRCSLCQSKGFGRSLFRIGWPVARKSSIEAHLKTHSPNDNNQKMSISRSDGVQGQRRLIPKRTSMETDLSTFDLFNDFLFIDFSDLHQILNFRKLYSLSNSSLLNVKQLMRNRPILK